MFVRTDQGEQRLDPGSDLTVEIEGQRFLVTTQGSSFATTDAPCDFDFGGIRGSAYLVRLASE